MFISYLIFDKVCYFRQISSRNFDSIFAAPRNFKRLLTSSFEAVGTFLMRVMAERFPFNANNLLIAVTKACTG